MTKKCLRMSKKSKYDHLDLVRLTIKVCHCNLHPVEYTMHGKNIPKNCLVYCKRYCKTLVKNKYTNMYLKYFYFMLLSIPQIHLHVKYPAIVQLLY